MSNIQKYVKKYYDGGLTMPSMNLDFGTGSTFDINNYQMGDQQIGSTLLQMPQANPNQIGDGVQLSGDYGVDAAQAAIANQSGFSKMLGNVKDEWGNIDKDTKLGMAGDAFHQIQGAFANPYDQRQEGVSKGEQMLGTVTGDIESIMQNPLNALQTGTDLLDDLASDNDATTYKIGEIGADVAGVGVGVGRIMSGDVIGGVKQTVGELADIGKSVFGRKKARKEQIAAEKQAKDDFFEREGSAAQQRVAAEVMSGQADKSAAATSGTEAMLEKYMKNQKTAKHGARLDFKEGGVNEGTRPLDLRTMKYYKGGILEKLKFEDGGEATPNIYEQLMSGQLTANTPMSDEQREAIENPKESKAITEHKKKQAKEHYEKVMDTGLMKLISGMGDAGDTAMLSGMATGNPLAVKYGTAVGAGEDIGHHLGVKIASMMPWHKDKDFSDVLKKTRLDAGFGVAGGPMKALGKLGKAGDLGVTFSDLAQKAYGTFKTTKAAKTIKNIIGDQNVEKIKQYAQDKYQDIKGGQQFAQAELVKGGKVSFDVKDYLSGGFLKEFNTGGMTPGEFSHKKNPLTVVDKKGNDTGMELTGGEGVFDKTAMTKLDKYKATKNYKKAGELVFSEMDSWKDAGTAKYGTRIKYK